MAALRLLNITCRNNSPPREGGGEWSDGHGRRAPERDRKRLGERPDWMHSIAAAFPQCIVQLRRAHASRAVVVRGGSNGMLLPHQCQRGGKEPGDKSQSPGSVAYLRSRGSEGTAGSCLGLDRGASASHTSSAPKDIRFSVGGEVVPSRSPCDGGWFHALRILPKRYWQEPKPETGRGSSALWDRPLLGFGSPACQRNPAPSVRCKSSAKVKMSFSRAFPL
ncbi:proline iminopeptidase [Anopheles sinensis]|uniref:Proline iminopeptidase n=1 Tax=Anopheles sinensis TaxID=74873 RepID=A0A084VVP9_ANOSI|nr:proline iminopeptidase [Anopheles sinensis]